MKGCYRTPHGWLCQVRIHGVLYQQRFPATASREIRQRWLTEQQIAHRHDTARRRSGLLRDDAVRYLAAVRAMPTFTDRQRHIGRWVDALGARQRASLTSAEISAQLQTWRHTLSASSCNHLRTALQHLWSVLDGKSAHNPVRDVPRMREPRPQPVSITYSDIQRALASMRDTPTRARLAVLAATGLPSKQVGLLTADDVDAAHGRLRVRGRSKGQGAPGRTLPLSGDAVRALGDLARHNAWGAFSNSSLNKAWKGACRRTLGRADWSVYSLRHAFATRVYANGADLHTVGELLLHSSPSLTARYALAAVPARLRAAVDIPTTPPPSSK